MLQAQQITTNIRSYINQGINIEYDNTQFANITIRRQTNYFANLTSNMDTIEKMA